MNKHLVALACFPLAVVALAGCGGTSTSSEPVCTTVTPVGDPDVAEVPSTPAGAAAILLTDVGETDPTFGPFYSVKVKGQYPGDVLGSLVTLPGKAPAVAVWFVPEGTHLLGVSDAVAQSVTLSDFGMAKVNESNDSYKAVVACINAAVK